MCRFGFWSRIFASTSESRFVGLGIVLRNSASSWLPRLHFAELSDGLHSTLDSPPGYLIPLLISLSTEWIVLLRLISCSSRYSSLQTNTLAFDVLYTRHCLMLVLLRLLLLLPTTFLSVVRGQSTFSYHLFYNVRCTAHVSCLLISRMITCIHSMIHRASPSPIS